MVRFGIIGLFILLSALAKGQAVFSLQNNISDLNPERDALSITQGTMRISYTPSNGGTPLDLTTAFQPITMRVSHRTDGFTNPIVGSFEVSTNSTLIRWNFLLNTPGEYRLQAEAQFTDDVYPIFDRYLTVYSAPTASININSNAVQVSVPVTITNVTTINYYGGSVTNL